MSVPPPRPEGCKHCQKNCAVFYTGIVDGKASKVAMCSDCPTALAMVDPTQFGLLSGLPGAPADAMTNPVYERCPECGCTPIDIKKQDRLGCPHCYRNMSRFIKAMITMSQPDDTHHGKRPADHNESATQERLAKLRSRLTEAIKREYFEDAAKLRDEIRALEAHLADSRK